MTRPVTETQTSLPENYILAHQHCFVFLTLNLHISIQMGNGLDVFLMKLQAMENTAEKGVLYFYLFVQGVSVKVPFSSSMSQGLNLIKYW